jgi:hypothetical protein
MCFALLECDKRASMRDRELEHAFSRNWRWVEQTKE